MFPNCVLLGAKLNWRLEWRPSLFVLPRVAGKRGNATRKQGEHKRSAAIKGMAFNEKHSTKLSKKASRVRLREKLKNLY